MNKRLRFSSHGASSRGPAEHAQIAESTVEDVESVRAGRQLFQVVIGELVESVVVVGEHQSHPGADPAAAALGRCPRNLLARLLQALTRDRERIFGG
ncbi:hypothetical protein [Antrihabitans cavernicola]|uniref:Uncharacterized protein n=1 Tax=Antrihabitans cavernicola TaxID=2495913 RepID=A0A5A7S513_9NOCA|nr:hypothetical protein [Spelaeibacter cavernicola]KAA0017649.1 hypothetical protein FOY51_24710 [Spelaeibacter cavernicola]